jgi:hypothetical protein
MDSPMSTGVMIYSRWRIKILLSRPLAARRVAARRPLGHQAAALLSRYRGTTCGTNGCDDELQATTRAVQRRLMAEWASYRNRPAASGRDKVVRMRGPR